MSHVNLSVNELITSFPESSVDGQNRLVLGGREE